MKSAIESKNDDKLAQESLELFYSKYQKKFTGMFLITHVNDGAIHVSYDNSGSDKGRVLWQSAPNKKGAFFLHFRVSRFFLKFSLPKCKKHQADWCSEESQRR